MKKHFIISKTFFGFSARVAACGYYDLSSSFFKCFTSWRKNVTCKNCKRTKAFKNES